MESICVASELEGRLVRSLALDLPYPERLALQAAKPAAVLILFGFPGAPSAAAGPSVLVIRRAEREGSPHSGQMAFPGGVCEPHELETEDGIVAAALRETDEEVGIAPQSVKVLGRLPVLPTVTGFRVHPVVGVLTCPLEESPLRTNPDEIAEALWVPLKELSDPASYRREHRQIGAARYPVHVFEIGGHRIWGATASMIKNLLDRLAALG